VLDVTRAVALVDRGFRGLATTRRHWHAPIGDRRTKDRLTDAERAHNRDQAGLRALVEQSIGSWPAWSRRRWRGLLSRVRGVFRAAARPDQPRPLAPPAPRLRSITDTLNDVPGLAAHRDRPRPDDGRSSGSGWRSMEHLAKLARRWRPGAATLCTTRPGDSLARTFEKEAALCLPRGADAGASRTGTTRRCSRSRGFPGPTRPRSAIRDRLSGLVMGR
jgi:hypothetical protein